MRAHINKGTWRRWIFWFLLIAAAIVLYKSFDKLSDVFSWLGSLVTLVTPIVGAFVIAYFLNRPMCFLARQFGRLREKNFFAKHARGISVAIVYVVFVAIIALLCYALVPSLISGITSLVNNSDNYIAAATSWFDKLGDNYPFLEGIDFGSSIIDIVITFLESIDVDTLIGYLKSIGNVGSVLADIAVSLFVSIYMLLEKEDIFKAIDRISSLVLKDSTRAAIGNYLTRANRVVYRYFATQFADCMIVSCMATIALLIMGAPSPVLLGFIFGMFNIIPYFGPIIGGVGVVAVILFARGFGFALTAAIILLVLQQIDANVINPKILGASLDMGPFWVIVAITVGGGLFGFTGMLLGVPMMVVTRMVYRDLLIYVRHKRERKAAGSDQETHFSEVVLSGDEEASVQHGGAAHSAANAAAHPTAANDDPPGDAAANTAPSADNAPVSPAADVPEPNKGAPDSPAREAARPKKGKRR